ncbi:MAG: TetR/AcrR family transcriptional regulator [Planctomycetota bacterium]|nr:TetR/AcrR family transcriptional regulator [Planctomycetota bacterium]
MPRQKEFDQAEALARAMDTFWRQGYEAASIADLEGQMRIGRGSMYLAFGDKHSLFVAALDAYCDKVVEGLSKAIHGAASTKEGLAVFLAMRLEEVSLQPESKGCFLSNAIAELAPRDERVTEIATRTLSRLEETIYTSLLRDRKAGRLPKGKRPRALARYLVSSIQGLTVMSRVGMGVATLRDIVGVLLDTLAVD